MTFVFGGQVIVGGCVSRATVTVNVQVVRLVQLSVAVQLTVVVPRGNVLPDGGEQSTATLVSALYVAVGKGHDTTAVVVAVPHSQKIRFVGH